MNYQQFLSHTLASGIATKFKYEVEFNNFSASLAEKFKEKFTDTKFIEQLQSNCIEAKLPERQFATSEYRYNGPTRKQYYNVTFDDLSLTFVCSSQNIPKFPEKALFDYWMSLMYDDKYNISYLDDIKADIVVYQKQLNFSKKSEDTYEDRIYGVRYIDAYPITIEAMDLSASSPDAQTLQVRFNYREWEVIEIE